MSRDRLLAAALADQRQIRAFQSALLERELAKLAIVTTAYGIKHPESLKLRENGICELEYEAQVLAFRAIISVLWPEMVKAFLRGAGHGSDRLPNAKALFARSTSEIAHVIDDLGMRSLREMIQEKSWAFASGVAAKTRRVVALIAAKKAGV